MDNEMEIKYVNYAIIKNYLDSECSYTHYCQKLDLISLPAVQICCSY